MVHRVEVDFEYKGLRCVVLVLTDRGYRCGYVGVPKEHVCYGKHYNDIESIEIHGGLTFSSKQENEDYPLYPQAGLWWFGFDCAHAWDLPDPNLVKNDKLKSIIHRDYIYRNDDAEIRTLEYVRKECVKLAEQLLKAVKT
jgi:hypothetical protein